MVYGWILSGQTLYIKYHLVRGVPKAPWASDWYHSMAY